MLLSLSRDATIDACTGRLAGCATSALGHTSSCQRVCCCSYSTVSWTCSTARGRLRYRAAQSARRLIRYDDYTS